MNSVLMVVTHVFLHEPEEMSFVQRDNMIQDHAAAASDPAFRGSVGKRRQLHRMSAVRINLSE
jgi:hypothetical protein